MENFLFKKSYQLKTFSSLPYESLWGANGIFTTVRLYGDYPDLILIDEHIKKFNSSVKKFNIHFKLTKEIDNIKVGSKIDVLLEKIENKNGEIVVSREKAKRAKS